MKAQEQELSRLVQRSYKHNLLEMEPHEYALFSSGSRIDVFSGATNPLSRAIHESRPAPMLPPYSECEQPITPKCIPRIEVSTKEASRRVRTREHLAGNLQVLKAEGHEEGKADGLAVVPVASQYQSSHPWVEGYPRGTHEPVS